MITIHAAMLVILGFLLAALLLLLFLPRYRRRIERFSTETLKRSLPLSETEIRADKDRVRAEYAIEVHKLEMKLEEAALSAARQSVEINRREAKIHELELAIDSQKSFVEEHENARRVLEQAIMDRLPKVEQRLSEARKLLAERDREIAALSETSARQTAAIEEATQINIQQADELHRVRAALETRAARNRETLGDSRFDGEVALRSEIEALRAKTRDQAALLERLQSNSDVGIDVQLSGELERLRSELARAESELRVLKAGEYSGAAERAAMDNHVRDLDAKLSEQAAELVRHKASLKAYEEAAAANEAGQENRVTARAELVALQAEVDDQRKIIQALKAEIAGSNERLARQAQHFRDEMRRLGSQPAVPPQTPVRPLTEAPRRSLAERIAQPRVPAKDDNADAAAHGAVPTPQPAADNRQGGYLRAVNGGSAPADNAAASASRDAGESQNSAEVDAVGQPQRRPRLLERISNIDKS